MLDARTPHREPGSENHTTRSREDAAWRATIVDAAIALGREAGSTQGVTMRGLAQHIGLSTTALYHHFSSKDDLERAARAKAARGLRHWLEVALQNGPSIAVTRWVECYASSDPRDPWLRNLLPDLRGCPEDLQEAANLVALPGLEKALEAASERNRLAAGIPPLLASWLMWSGAQSILQLRAALDPSGDGADTRLVGRLANAVVHGVLSQPASRWRGSTMPPRESANTDHPT